MYVYKQQVTTQRGIATLLAIALVLWAIGAHTFSTAEAANLTYVKDTLSNSDSGSPSNHTIEFLSPTGVAAGQTITVTFPTGFTGTSSILFTDIDFQINGAHETIVNGAPGATEWGFTWTGPAMTLTAGGSESLPVLATATIRIGTNATQGGPGVNRIINPTATTTSYEIVITAGPSDTGRTRVAITDNVLVTATVETSLSFIVYGTTTGAVVNGSGTTTAADTTHQTLPFGVLANNVSKTLAQDLTIATNARNGYVVTVHQSGNLQSSTGADIDSFIHGAYTNTPTAWAMPIPDIGNENTWGHWGLTSNDTDLHGAGLDFTADTWVGASTTPRAIMAHTGPSDGVTLGIGRATIGYQAAITPLQEAGDDYNTTLTYIATPTF
jgi:hypothetical protein